MEILASKFERVANRIKPYDNTLFVVGVIVLVISLMTTENGKPFGFVMLVLSFWCLGPTQLVKFYATDEHGISKVRSAPGAQKRLISIFMLFWFTFLIVFTVIIVGFACKPNIS